MTHRILLQTHLLLRLTWVRRHQAVKILSEFSVPLIAGVVGALIWANLDFVGYQQFLHRPLLKGTHFDVHFLVNDIFLAFFFGIAAKEITESCLPGGALNPPSKAINPILGTLGGVLGPVAIYFSFVFLGGGSEISNGWAIPTATDITLAWLVARLAFGPGHPAISFLLLLAVADDAIGLGIIAIFYPDPLHAVRPIYLILVGAAIGLAIVLRRRGVRSFWPYLLGPGVLSWMGLFSAHLHPALALVPVVPFMPSMGYDEGLFREEGDAHHHNDTLNNFEHYVKVPVDFGLFGFGIANAGVAFSSVGSATWAVLFSLLVGKSMGIFLFSWGADRFGFKLPDGISRASLFVLGLTAGIGLTVSLFMAGVAFTDPTIQGAAKMGALLSAGIAPIVLVLAKVMRLDRRSHPEFRKASLSLVRIQGKVVASSEESVGQV